MARPRSEEKRLALLNAATRIVAELGLSAPTSAVARAAGVAEGTLFRYFPTKEDLLNELYLHIKADMCAAMASIHVPAAGVRDRVQSLWNAYIDWGLANPQANKAANQLTVSAVLKPETQAQAMAMFPDASVAAGFSGHPVFAGQEDFVNAVFLALADTTHDFAARDPAKSESYKASGFAALWRMYGDG